MPVVRGSRGRTKPPTYTYFDLNKLREFRKRHGWNVEAAAAATGIPSSTICHWEAGNQFPPPHRLRALCLGYELDPFEVCELLLLYPLPRGLLRRFRAACKKDGTTPIEALINFVSVYVSEIQKGE